MFANLEPHDVVFLSLALLGAAVSVWLLYAADKSNENSFRAVDLILCDNRACLDKLVLALFAMVSAWVIVHVVLTGATIDPTLLLGVLTIFVLKRTADKVTTAITTREQRPE